MTLCSWKEKAMERNDRKPRKQVLDIIRNRQRRWLGHTLRHGDLLTMIIAMEGRIRARGPQDDVE